MNICTPIPANRLHGYKGEFIMSIHFMAAGYLFYLERELTLDSKVQEGPKFDLTVLMTYRR